MFPCPHCKSDTTRKYPTPDGIVTCKACHETYQIPMLPLFVLTGPRASGKTTIGRSFLNTQDHVIVIEAEYHWSARKAFDPEGYWNYLLLQCVALAQNGKPPLLCGWVAPTTIVSSSNARFFSDIHILVLGCEPDVHSDRVRGRYPKQRRKRATEDEVMEDIASGRMLKAEAETLQQASYLDTTHQQIEESSKAVLAWMTSYLS